MSDTKDCDIKGCNKPALSPKRKWCGMHYARNRRHGDPLTVKKHSTVEASFLARRADEGCCVVWTGFISPNGYGKIGWQGKVWLAHRYAWFREYGEIPEGKDLDHICRNRKCVKIEHLRAVSRAENLQNQAVKSTTAKSGYRGVHVRPGNKWAASVTHEGVTYYFGENYSTVEEALEVVIAKRLELYTHNELDRAYMKAKPAA